MFRRRHQDTFVPYHSQPYTYLYDPITNPLPQQWRNRGDAGEIFLLPVGFIVRFADKGYLQRIQQRDQGKIGVLRDSMVVEGQIVPMGMNLDPSGKLRFHDGYHRLCVALERPDLFPLVPVLLDRGTGAIRGYGRNLYEETEFIFEWLGRWRP